MMVAIKQYEKFFFHESNPSAKVFSRMVSISGRYSHVQKNPRCQLGDEWILR